MPCSQCQGIELEFDRKSAASGLRRYRKRGAAATTRTLIDALRAEKVDGMTLLDIGGGVGVIQHELLEAGLSRVTGVEASGAFLEAAKEEATRMGHIAQSRFFHGDFVELAPAIPSADIVTLDRVICCYADMPPLVGLSSARARRLYGLVYPRDTWWNRIGLTFLNFLRRLQRRSFRVFVHRTEDIDTVIRKNGLLLQFHRQTFVWRVDVYSRPAAAAR